MLSAGFPRPAAVPPGSALGPLPAWRRDAVSGAEDRHAARGRRRRAPDAIGITVGRRTIMRRTNDSERQERWRLPDELLELARVDTPYADLYLQRGRELLAAE